LKSERKPSKYKNFRPLGNGLCFENKLQKETFDCTHEDSFIFSFYFYKGRAQNNESKEQKLYIKENQNKSSQSFLRNPSTLKSPLAHLCLIVFHFWGFPKTAATVLGKSG